MVNENRSEVHITADASQAEKSFRDLSTSAKQMEDAVQEADKAIEALVEGFGLSEEAAKELQQALAPMAERVKEDAAALKELPQAYRQALAHMRDDMDMDLAHRRQYYEEISRQIEANDQLMERSNELRAERTRFALEQEQAEERTSAEARRAELDQLRQDIIQRNDERLAHTRQTLEGEVDAERQAAQDRARELNQLKDAILERDQEMVRSGDRYAAESRDWYEMEAAERKRQSDLIKGQMQDQSRLAESTGEVTSATRGLAATRYALYDVATTWGTISAATLGAASAVEIVGANYEYAFSSVQRVTQTAGEEAAVMKQDLKDLASTIHEEFDSIAEVATLGGQMGVAADEIKEFTRNVTMFGATTSATVQETAMGFGRIAQMTKAGSDAWENIGSAIYQVGINSVATESQILRVAQEIATAGNLAGFTTDEVIGLSGALASLNIQPERARGNILRLFSELDKATADGGEQLDMFARNARMSAEEFTQAWAETPEAAFRSLLEGMKSAVDEGANLSQLIRDMGIVNVRDVQTMQQLVNNVEIYVASMGHANEAYREGTALLDAYGIRSDTVIGKMQILNNVVRNIMDSLSSTSAIKFFLDAFIEVGRAIEKTLKIPAVAWVGSLGVALLGIVGISAAVRAAMAALQASILAITLALQHLSAGVIPENRRGIMGLIGSLGELNAVMRGTQVESAKVSGALNAQTGATQRLTAATTQATAAQTASAASGGRLAAMGGRVAGAFKTAGGTIATLVGSLRFVPQLAAVSAAIWGVSKAINAFAGRAEHAKNVARDFFGSMSGLSEAIAQDTQTYEEAGEYMRLLAVNTEDGSIAWDSAKLSQEELAKAIANTTDEVEQQIVAMGEATEQALLQSIMDSDNFVETWDTIKSAARAAGIEIEDVVDGLKTGDISFLDGVVENTIADSDRITAEILSLGEEIKRVESELWQAEFEGDSVTQAALEKELSGLERVKASREERLAQIGEEIQSAGELQTALEGFAEIASELVGKQASANDFLAAWGVSAEDGAEHTDELTDSLEAMFSELERAHEVEGSLDNLVSTLLDSGSAIDEMSEGGRASFKALMDTVSMFSEQADGDLWDFGQSLVGMFAYTEGAGIQFGNEVDFLRQQMVAAFNEQWGISLDISNARGSIHDFIQDAIQAIRVRAELERQMISRVQSSGLDNWAAASGIDYRGDQLKYHQDNLNMLNQQISSLESLQAGLSKAREQGRRAADTFYNPPGRKSGGGRKSPMAKDARDAADEIRTLTDYVKDLNSVSKAAFDFRFGMVVATDQLEAAKRTLQEMRDDALKRVADAFDGLSDARQKVVDLRVSLQELNASVRGLQADQSKLEYFYEIAVEYGDTKRAEQISAELAKVQADLAKAENDRAKTNADLEKAQSGVTEASKELSQAQADSKRTLTENTKSSADQRKAVMDLVQAYQNQIIELVNSGASQKEVERRSTALRKEFEKELTQLGYNREEVRKYGESFKDLSTIIKNIPPANIKADTNPARRAIDDFIASASKRTATIKTQATTPSIGAVSGGVYRPSGVAVGSGGMTTPNLRATNISGGGGAAFINQMRDVGGYTGAGGQYSAKGVFHGGEYIFPKSAVNQQTGLPHADVMARMMVGTRELNALLGGARAPQASGPSTVALTPGTVQAIAQAVQPYLVVNDKVIAGANNRSAVSSTSFGKG